MTKAQCLDKFHQAADEMIAAEVAAQCAVAKAAVALERHNDSAGTERSLLALSTYCQALDVLGAALARRKDSRADFKFRFEEALEAGASNRELEHPPLQRFAGQR